jgi:hypothetical protein
MTLGLRMRTVHEGDAGATTVDRNFPAVGAKAFDERSVSTWERCNPEAR